MIAIILATLRVTNVQIGDELFVFEGIKKCHNDKMIRLLLFRVVRLLDEHDVTHIIINRMRGNVNKQLFTTLLDGLEESSVNIQFDGLCKRYKYVEINGNKSKCFAERWDDMMIHYT